MFLTPYQPFILDFLGRFSPASVHVVWRDSAEHADPEIERLKTAWPVYVQQASQQGKVLFNGPMVRYLGHRLTDDRLMIETEPTDYATFFCTNWLNHAEGDRIGWHKFANPLGISANVITSDGWILYGRRNHKVACHAGMVHTFGGTVSPDDRNADGEIDVFASMTRELREELGLVDDELSELVCLGMIRDPEFRQPELIFDAQVRCGRAALEARIQPDDSEHAAVVACADRPDAYEDFIGRSKPIVPVAVGSLCLHAWRSHGQACYDRLIQCLM